MGIEYPRPDALSPARLLTPQEGDELGLDRELFWSWNQIVLRSRFSGTPAGLPWKTGSDSMQTSAILTITGCVSARFQKPSAL